MPTLYRRWAMTRLHDLGPCVRSWELDMFAGIAARGAEDAWYLQSLDIEIAKLCGQDAIGGAADLFKCFDQIIRPLLYLIRVCAGFPHRVPRAYIRYHEHAVLHYIINGAVGQPHRHPCGIPQGCLFSMIFVALLLRAWLVQMRSFQVTARALADDLLVFATGSQALSKFAAAFQTTLQHMLDLGGRVSAPKSKLFASHHSRRDWLRRHLWAPISALASLWSPT